MTAAERRERARARFHTKIELRYVVRSQFAETLRHLRIRRNRDRFYTQLCTLFIDCEEINIDPIDSRIWCRDPYFIHGGVGEKERVPEIMYHSIISTVNTVGFASIWGRLIYIEYLMVRRIAGYLGHIVASKPLRRIRARRKIIIWNKGKFAPDRILGNILHYLTY